MCISSESGESGMKLKNYLLDCYFNISMDQIELNCVLILNWIVWNRTVFCIKMDLALKTFWKKKK